MIKVLSQCWCNIVSSTLASSIKSHLFSKPTSNICGSPLIIENDNDCDKLYESGWSSITVKEYMCDSINGSLLFENDTCLQYIHIQSSALYQIDSLGMINLPNLKSVIIESSSFENTNSLVLSGNTTLVNFI